MPAPLSQAHARTAAECESHLQTTRQQGLSASEVVARQQRFGRNEITPPAGRPAWRRFADQLLEPLVLVLIASGTVTASLGEWPDASVIFGVVLVNAVIGFWQEAKAEGALNALARSVATPVTVRREGHRRTVDASDLVPGDVVILGAGDRVPADIRLYKARELQTNESSLTGESAPVPKHIQPLAADTLLADRANMLHAGTTLVSGQAGGYVVATGDSTQTGHIAGLIASAPDLVTPLTRKMAAFSGWLIWIIGGFALLTVAVGLARGESVYAMFIAAVALAVGAIPEGLPAAVTVTLAIGVARMARRRAIIRRLPAVETLGSTTVICSDKTGTLTENAMTVRTLWCGGQEYAASGDGYRPEGTITRDGQAVPIDGAVHEALRVAALCNDAGLVPPSDQDAPWAITGDPTEAALLVVARKGGLEQAPLRQIWVRVDEIPFDANRQFMATLHQGEGQGLGLIKGAVERLLPRCRQQLAADGTPTVIDTAEVLATAQRLAEGGQRVLALARFAHDPATPLADADLADLVLVGLVGMIDPPRPQAIRAVATCQAAGIRVKMITGDHAATAQAIARRLGIPADAVRTGRDLAAMDDQELADVVQAVDVFARVEPEQKLRLVRALQARGEVVAMTGDGVNDAPALKSADIGVAMGLGGTEVAKEAAAMVLTDDNFASIEAAVEEGRGVWDNLIKFITWTLPTNFGEGLVIVAAILFGVTLPITPLQVLWINMTTAVLLGMPLAFEPVERGVMSRRPRAPNTPVLDGRLIGRIVLVSLLLLGGAFGLFVHALDHGHSLAEARTIAINVFVLVEAFYLFNCRSLSRSFWSMGLFTNPWIWGGVGAMAVLQGLLTYWPPLNAIFKTAPIGWSSWGLIIAVAWASSLIIALEKRLGRGRST